MAKKKSPHKVVGFGTKTVTLGKAGEAAADISAVPRKEFCIELIERLGVKAVYPTSTETAEAAIARINGTPDTKWYPPNDVYWNDHERPIE